MFKYLKHIHLKAKHFAPEICLTFKNKSVISLKNAGCSVLAAILSIFYVHNPVINNFDHTLLFEA